MTDQQPPDQKGPPPFDPAHPMIGNQFPQWLMTGKHKTPQGDLAIFTFRVPNATVTAVLTKQDAQKWIDQMQAEVDKYVASYWLMRRQFPDRFPAELLRILFERTRIDSRLAAGRESLYREASRYAQMFCRRLERSLRGARGRSQAEVLTELRRFYRLTNARKVAHIQRTA